MATTTDLGFSPEYFMPVIPPPVSGPYGTYTVTPDSLDPSDLNAGLKFTISPPSGATKHDNYLMVDGSITFVRATYDFPIYLGVLGGETADFNSIIIHINPVSSDVLKKHLPPGVPPAEYIIIENINESDFTTDLTNHLTAVANAASPINSPFESSQFLKYLDIYWKESQGNTTGTIADKINLIVDNVLSSDSQVACRAGLKLGSIINNVAGNAEFNIRMIESAGVELITPIAYLKNMDLLPDATKGARWTSHPLKAALSGYATPLDIYLKFEIWNPLSVDDPSEPEYVPIDAGCEVQLMDYDQGTPVQVDSSLYTDSNGNVTFSFNPLPPGSSDPFPDLFFVIVSPESSKYSTYNSAHSPGITLPSEWSTKAANGTDNWLSVDGTPGYFENFSGFKLGKVAARLTYRIGVDFHLKLQYKVPFKPAAQVLPPCIKVELLSDSTLYETCLTNTNGEVHGINFTINPNEDLYYRVYFETEDSEIHLKKTRILFIMQQATSQFWNTKNDGDCKIHYLLNRQTSLNSPNSSERNKPDIMLFTKDVNNYAFYFLKIVREIHYFLNYFTNGSWLGIDVDLFLSHIFDFLPGITATSYPKGTIQFSSKKDNWDRGTIVHEYFHQVMWEVANYSNTSIATQFAWDTIADFDFSHYFNGVSTESRALTEGWSGAFANIFGDFSLYLTNKGEAYYELNLLTNATQLDPETPLLNPDRGYFVEGAVANALTYIFWDHVVGDDYIEIGPSNTLTTNKKIIESNNGNIIDKNPWLPQDSTTKSIIVNRFQNYFWNPLTDLTSYSLPDSFNLIDKIKVRNSATANNVWHILRADFLLWNISIGAFPTPSNYDYPSISSLNFDNYSLIDIQSNVIVLECTGSGYFINKDIGFTHVQIKVKFGKPNINGVPVYVYSNTNSINVLDENRIEFQIPAFIQTGLVDIVLETYIRKVLVNTHTKTDAFTYL
ncbi:MAG: hypothetical protein IPO70_11125 [Bacteroidetes bacterium]|nr:hypothetical protein [Bacteroidota bacterium]MBK9672778.1 hypothetical protein [Bacteroidota bacterium]MBP6412037.1 hypothetical protein [Bacteroidia bacterium]